MPRPRMAGPVFDDQAGYSISCKAFTVKIGCRLSALRWRSGDRNWVKQTGQFGDRV